MEEEKLEEGRHQRGHWHTPTPRVRSDWSKPARVGQCPATPNGKFPAPLRLQLKIKQISPEHQLSITSWNP
ncbi:hypothetical protein RRG08_037933 [Elysia crispata]|uniref:Uncharacterized protein n=1 Tax=Elysia crispata TaxID=231223 RepID=A0AAE1DAF5_9GAST|nr:hypothetical protein RRG08_037933 [Elysia crispata]